MRKIGCAIVIVILVSLVGGYFFITSYLSEERLTKITKDFLSQTFKRPVEVKRVSLQLGFGIKIGVDDIQVPNTKGYEADNLLEIKNMAMRVSLLPLLQKKVVVKKTEISQPRINVEKGPDGKMNLPPLPFGKVEGEGFSLDLRDVTINSGIVNFEDYKEKKSFLVQNLNQHIKAKKSGLKMNGGGRFLYSGPGFKEPIMLKFENYLELDTVDKVMKINPSNISLGKAILTLEGTVDKKELNISAQGKDFEIGEMIKLIPVKDRAGINIQGKANTGIDIRGSTKKPEYKFSLSGQDLLVGTIKYPELSKIDLELEGDDKKIDLKKLNMRRRNSRLKLTGVIYPQKQIMDIAGSGRVYGQDLSNLLPGLKGNIDVDFSAKGKLNKPDYRAKVVMHNGYYGELEKIDLNCILQPDVADIKKLNFNIHNSDLAIAGRISNFKKPNANISLKSKKLDLDKFSGSAKGSKGKKGSKTPLPNINGRVRFDIDRLKIQDNDLRRVKGTAIYRNDKFTLQGVSFQAYGGNGSGKGEIRITDPAPYDFEVRARDLDARRLFKKFLGISNIKGKFRTRLTTKGVGFDESEVKRNLRCDGYITLHSGEFVNFGFTNRLLEWLKITEKGKFKFKDFNATIKIRKGRVRFDDALVQTRSADYLFFGTLGFDGRIDYRITVTFNRIVSKKLRKLHADWIFYTDSRGRVIVDIFARGTLEHPKFSLDKKRIQKRIKKKIKTKIDKEKERIIKKLKDLWG